MVAARSSVLAGLVFSWISARAGTKTRSSSLKRFEPPFFKLASASLTDLSLLRKARATGRPVMISTGMSTGEEIRTAVEIVGPHAPGGRPGLFIAHSTSTHPCKLEESCAIPRLKAAYPEAPIGYSGHETGLAPTGAAVALGASFIERHITLDRVRSPHPAT